MVKIKTLDRFTEQKLMYSRKMVEYQDFLDGVYGGKLKSLRDTLETNTSEVQADKIRNYHKTKIGIRKYDLFHLNINPCVDKVADFMEGWLRSRKLQIDDPSISEKIAPLTKYINAFDQIMAIGLLRPLLGIHKAETVVWKKDVWDLAMNSEGLTPDVVLDPKAFPVAPQFWVPDTTFGTAVNLMMSKTYGLPVEEDGSITGELEAVFLYPVPLDTLTMTDSQDHQIWVAGVFVRAGSALVVLPSPVMTYDTSTGYSEELMEKFMQDLIYKGKTADEVGKVLNPVWANSPEVDEGGVLVVRPAPPTMARAILSAMLFMNESYVGVDRKPVNGDGIIRESGGISKKVRHYSKVSHVELRRPLKRVTGVKPGGREYKCQWIVRGHWRKYKEPTKEGKTLVRIPDYIKGPEDAPMKTTTRVITVSR